ncbi:Radical SAM domain protein [Thermoproteus uzoniensis 768-20]|uniref:Elongator complex protein 3 n=1 Tax=Thermoproteus uzoniensis (strain 768-20) TaxID=999630 RepID=F2L5Q9_THEU7|nr:elongator complex protein 3 [Thermoproteus uzoniensis]AEA13605.1 Radical SAM domain protein [Thermoproteus uzoniensis 768-20]
MELPAVRKPVRSASGVHVVALMTGPSPCPGQCVFCPTARGVPKSYMPDSPAVMRASRSRYDPYRQVVARISNYLAGGHRPSKIEAIVMGGTFTALPRSYQFWFVGNLLKALNDYPNWSSASAVVDIEAEQARNETAALRLVALTVETRPDYLERGQIDDLLEMGVTRVEIGVQSIYDDVLSLVRRGHGVKEVVEATARLKDAAYKVCYHLMPGLPGSDPDRDLEMFRTVFEDPAFKPDCVKIYPTLVVPGTELYDWWRSGRYRTYDEETWRWLLAEIYASVPRWVRVMRLGRDIPLHHVVDGPRWGNMREVVEEEMERRGLHCSEIRCREAGIKAVHGRPADGNIEYRRHVYEASGGLEYFFEAVGRDDTLYGILRLRIPANPWRPEIDRRTALVRELHVYGPEVPVGADGGPWPQHKGIGRKLMALAEEAATAEAARRVVVISGIGARPYFAKLGYKRCGPYMCKEL